MNKTLDNQLFQIVQLATQEQEKGNFLTYDAVEPFLSEMITFRTVPKGEHITTINTPLTKVHYIISGSFSIVRSSIDGKNSIRSEKAPQFLGIDCTILSYNSYFPNILALETCFVLEINQAYFIQSIKESGEFGFQVLHMICKKFFNISYRYDQALFYDTATKLIIYIVNYWIANCGQEDMCIITVKNNSIAEAIGVSVRTLYRAINKLKSDNLLSIVSGNISVTKEQIDQMQSLCLDSKDIIKFDYIL